MQNLNIQQTDSATPHFNTQAESFSSTQVGLKQRYMQDFLKDLKKAEDQKTQSSKDILFKEIQGLLADF